MVDQLRFLVVRRDVDNTQPFAVGDEVVTYELAEPWPYASLPPHSGHTQALLDYEAAVLERGNRGTDWRLHEVLRCTCKDGRAVAQVLVHEKSARLWVTAKPEHVPAVFRGTSVNEVDGWPLHGRAGEAPHVGGVASCKACRTRWLVVSFEDRAELIRILAARHGARVAP